MNEEPEVKWPEPADDPDEEPVGHPDEQGEDEHGADTQGDTES